jgi:hypothetical protein
VGPARYTQLAAALPGVATNLLAERLRTLESAGVIERRFDAGYNGVVYALTAWGAELRDTVDALVRWSTPLMRPGRGDDTFRGPWLVTALRALLVNRTSSTPVAVGLEVAGDRIAVRRDRQGVEVSLNPDAMPTTVLRGAPEVVLALAAGALTPQQAVDRATLDGDVDELRAVFEAGAAPSV